MHIVAETFETFCIKNLFILFTSSITVFFTSTIEQTLMPSVLVFEKLTSLQILVHRFQILFASIVIVAGLSESFVIISIAKLADIKHSGTSLL